MATPLGASNRKSESGTRGFISQFVKWNSISIPPGSRMSTRTRPPLGAFLRGNPRGGVIGGNIEPSRVAVDEKHIFFRRLVLPAHFAGSSKICGACLHADDASVFPITFKKRGLQGANGVISRLQPRDDSLYIQSVVDCEKEKKQGVKPHEHDRSLARGSGLCGAVKSGAIFSHDKRSTDPHED